MSEAAANESQIEGTDLADRLADYDDPQAPLRALLALEAGRMGSWRWDIVAGTVRGDPFVADLLNMDFAAQPWPVGEVFASMHPDDLPRVQAQVDAALAGADLYEVEFRDRVTNPQTGEEGLRWLGARGRVTRRDAEGNAIEMIGVNWDATAQKTHEERLAMLASEMDHRVKNAFAIMRALVNIGRRRATDLASFADDLGAQVQAMADAHEIAARLALSGGDPRPVVPTAEVIETALAPWIAAHPDQVTVSLDRRLALPASRVSALSMLIQELAANAAKHGALRRPDANRQGANGQDAAGQDGDGGKLTVTVERTRRDGALFARLVWNETVAAPLRPGEADRPTSGFGDVLIEHCLASLEAAEERELRPEGLKLAVVLPLPGTKASAAQ